MERIDWDQWESLKVESAKDNTVVPLTSLWRGDGKPTLIIWTRNVA